MANKNELNVWLEKARELRANFFKHEAKFFIHLLKGETQTSMWRGPYSSFENLLQSAFKGLVDVGRYASFRAGYNNFVKNEAKAEKIGVDAVIQIGKVKSDRARDELMDHASAKAEERGYPLSAREMKNQAEKVEPTARPVGPTAKAAHQESQLALEVAALRRENAVLRRENERLKTRLKKIDPKFVEKRAN